MFTIYDGGTRTFQGTLERLNEFHPVQPVLAVAPYSPASMRKGAVPEGADRQHGHASPPASAVAAYRDALQLPSREPILHAHQIMHAPVVTVRADVDLGTAWERLREHGVRQMPVQTPEIELVGLLSERELLEQLIIESGEIRNEQTRTVAEVMRREVITAEPVTDVRRIARVLADRQMTAMPIVTAQDELVGILSRGDLLRAMTQTPPLHLWT